jgi:amino acid transporter
MTVTGPKASAPGLLRAMGRFDLVAAICNGVVGSGIFGLPAAIAAQAGAKSPLAYLLGGVGVFTIVLCFAEVSSRFQDSGGPYLYARATFGPLFGFQIGWLLLWTRLLSGAAVLNLFAEHLAQLLPVVGRAPWHAASLTGLVAFLALLNVLGVRQATWAVNLFTIAKLLPLLLLVLLGASRISGEVLQTQAVAAVNWPQAVLLVMFACGGFESGVIAAAEARQPKRDMAFGLIVAMTAVIAIYASVQLVVVGIVPHVAAVGSAPLAAAFRILLGPAGGTLAVVAVLLSTYGWMLGFILQTPRLLFSMAERGELPRVLGHVHRRFRTPDVAVLTCAALALALALHGSFAWAATVSVVTRLLVYMATCAALVALRLRRPDEAPGFRLPAGTPIAVLGIGFCLWLLATRSYEQIWILLGLVAAGGVLWALRRVDTDPARPTMDAT